MANRRELARRKPHAGGVLLLIACALWGPLATSRAPAADFDLRLRGAWTPGPAVTYFGIPVTDVAVRDGHAFLTLEGGENPVLAVIDIRDPANLRKVGSYEPGQSSGWDVAVSGNYAYVVGHFWDDQEPSFSRGWLHVVDIKDPENPSMVGQWETEGRFSHVEISGNMAYVTVNSEQARRARLEIIDLSDPTAPVWVGGYDITGNGSRVAVSGNLVCMTVWWHDGAASTRYSLNLIDVSNQTTPATLGEYIAEHGVGAVAISGGYAYLGVNNGFEVIDISNPAEPQRVGRHSSYGGATQIVPHGRFAYVTATLRRPDDASAPNRGRLEVFDVSDPANLRRVAGYSIGRSAVGAVVHGNVAYVASRRGLLALDIINPASLQRVGSFNTRMYASGLATAGDLINLIGQESDELTFPPYSGVLETLRLTNPTALEFVGRYAAINERFLDVAVSEGVVYLSAHWTEGVGDLQQIRKSLDVIETRVPHEPERVGRQVTQGYRAAVAGSLAFLGDAAPEGQGGLHIVDWSDPAVPQTLGSYSPGTGSQTWCIGAADGYAYVVADTYSDRSGRNMGGYINPFLERHRANDFWWGQPSTSLIVFDVVNPSNPVPIAEHDFAGEIHDAVLIADVLYALVVEGTRISESYQDGLDGQIRLDVVDLGEPASQRVIGSYELLRGDAYELSDFLSYSASGRLAVAGTHIYVAGGLTGVQVIDVRDRTSPRRVGGNRGIFDAQALSVHGDHVYVAAGSDGLIILNKYTELRIGPAIVLSDGRVLLHLSGPTGQCVRVQRSANLIDWEDWRTVTLDGTGCELIDETAAASQRFYRAVEDNSLATK